MVISCPGQTVFAFDTFIVVGSYCFWKSISWRSSMMTSRPISRSYEFKAVSTRNFFNLTGEHFWLSSQKHFNFGREKETPRRASGNRNRVPFSKEVYCANTDNYFCRGVTWLVFVSMCICHVAGTWLFIISMTYCHVLIFVDLLCHLQQLMISYIDISSPWSL